MRDYSRLGAWVPNESLAILGLGCKDDTRVPFEWTRDSIVAQMREDVAFGFEKALNQRGISAGLMYDVVLMWLWILEDTELEQSASYPMYGLPLFKAVAVKYGFPNEIEDDRGDEDKYNE
jgi:hypothetical protein